MPFLDLPFRVPGFFRRPGTRERYKRGKAARIKCTRCGEWTRIPTYQLELGVYALCSTCVMDDLIECERVPSPRIYGQELDMAKWSDDAMPETTQRREYRSFP